MTQTIPKSGTNPSKRKPFQKVLVANRGEIAVRIIKTLKEMGIQAVALASEADQAALHVQCADEVIFLTGHTSNETYLQGEKIIELAKSRAVEAIHPGYGFLSESAAFAEHCEANSIVFIGPSPHVIQQMGHKVQAKSMMEKAGIPVIPGVTLSIDTSESDSGQAFQLEQSVVEAVNTIGYPVIVKASVGGGGRGMRRVNSPELLQKAIEAAQRESQQAFGNNEVFIEKYIENPRHIEFQILGDTQGNHVHLFERECSIQRRHQKIIEESPASNLNPELKKSMGEAAVKAAKAVNYVNAGTVEFIVTPDEQFYFLEMNTRLQVEHPVTEMVTGTDLVRLQLQVAAGEVLPFTQNDLKVAGHAIECRICAENPLQDFMPNIGKLDFFRPPVIPFVRIDSGVSEGDTISIYYDSMLAKLIVYAPNRLEAIAKVKQALQSFVIMGVENNIRFLLSILNHSQFIQGDIHTHFIENSLKPLLQEAAPSKSSDWSSRVWLTAGLFLATREGSETSLTRASDTTNKAQYSPWHTNNRRLQP